MLRLSRRLSLSTRFARVSTDTDGDLDELNSQYKKFTEKRSFASKISPSKKAQEYRKQKKEFEKFYFKKTSKDFLMHQAAHKFHDFTFEHSASWLIKNYGQPGDVIEMGVIRTPRGLEKVRTGWSDPMMPIRANAKVNTQKLQIRVLAAALNVEDLHVARGWCAFHNHFRADPIAYASKIVRRWSQGRPDDAIVTTNANMSSNATEFPIVLGREFCGEVLDCASDMMYEFPPGSKVVGYLKPWQSGALSECIVAKAYHCGPLPSNLSSIEGAGVAFGANYIMNALIGPQDDRNPYLNLRRMSQERSFAKAADYAGKNVIVLGIGGLGSMCAQILRCLGANVTIICSEEASLLAEELGFQNVFNYESYEEKDEMLDDIMESLDFEKFFAAVDCSRGGSVEDNFEIIGPMMSRNDSVVISLNSPETAVKDSMNLIQSFGWRSTMRSIEKEMEKHLVHFAGKNDLGKRGLRFRFSTVMVDHRNLLQVLDWLQEGKIRPCVDSVYDFENIPDALERINEGSLRGKIIVNLAGEESFENTCGSGLYFKTEY